MKMKAIKQTYWAEHENSDRLEDVGDIPAERIHATKPEGIPDELLELVIDLHIPVQFPIWGKPNIPHEEIEIDLSDYGWTPEDGIEPPAINDYLVEASCQMINEARAQNRKKQ